MSGRWNVLPPYEVGRGPARHAGDQQRGKRDGLDVVAPQVSR